MKIKLLKREILSYILGTIFLLLAVDIHIACNWVSTQFPVLDIESILFYVKVPLVGTNMVPFRGVIIKCLTLGPIIALAILWLTTKCRSSEILVLNICKWRFHFPLEFWHRFYALIALVLFLFITGLDGYALGINTWISHAREASSLFEDQYVPPQETVIRFPDQKRNLIYIFMESMETSYTSTEFGGNEPDNLIPELVQLSLENTNFTASNTYLNGAYSPSGTTWTIGAMVAQTAGIPLKVPIEGNSMDTVSSFLPGSYTLGDLLQEQGYHQEFLLGSDVVFGGRGSYMINHGDYALLDYYYAIEQGWIPPDYYVFWGYEDQKLYEYAKNELARLARENEPFNLTMLTVDTHFIDGYYCDLCENQYAEQYSNVISCASRQVNDFICWIQEQDFYENTTIVIAGDHPTMDTAYLERVLPDVCNEPRRAYVTIINPAISYELDYDRSYTTFDLYPTTVAALGAEIEGDRLGLGVNLFSDTPTLMETMGFEDLNSELSKMSSYYNLNLLYGL